MAKKATESVAAVPQSAGVEWRAALVGLAYVGLLVVAGVATLIGSSATDMLLRASLIASLVMMGWGIVSNLRAKAS